MVVIVIGVGIVANLVTIGIAVLGSISWECVAAIVVTVIVVVAVRIQTAVIGHAVAVGVNIVSFGNTTVVVVSILANRPAIVIDIGFC